jgi:hypothetical protein
MRIHYLLQFISLFFVLIYYILTFFLIIEFKVKANKRNNLFISEFKAWLLCLRKRNSFGLIFRIYTHNYTQV